MAWVIGDRSRTASIVCNAKEQLETGVAVPGLFGSVATTNLARSGSQGLGFRLSVQTSIAGKGYQGDGGIGPPYNIRFYIMLRHQLFVDIPYHGSEELDIEFYSFGYGDWQEWGFLPFQGGGIATWEAGGLDGVLSGTLATQMYLEEANTSEPWKEYPTHVTASLTVNGSYTFDYYGEVVVPVSYSASFDREIPFGSGIEITPDDWHCTLSFSAVKSIEGSMSLSAPGIGNYGSVSGSVGNAYLSGSPMEGVFSMSTINKIGNGSITAGPEWAHVWTWEDYDYETGNPISTTADLMWGDELISSGSGGTLRFPTEGYAAYTSGTAYDGITTGTVGYNAQRLGNYSSTTYSPGTKAYLRVNKAWADEYGTLANSANFGAQGSVYHPKATPDFNVGSITVEDVHTFDFLESASNWSSVFVAVSDAGEAVMFHAPMMGNSVTGCNQVFRPIYRYYRFEAMANEAGATIGVQILRKVGTYSNGDPRYAYYFWDFTINEAATYQTLEIDLCHPHRSYDDYHFGLANPEAPHTVHPADYAVFPTTPQILFTLDHGKIYWCKDFQGFHKSDGARYPLLIQGPCQTGDPTPRSVGIYPPTNLDACIPYEEASAVSGGSLAFRLVNNGAVFNLTSGSSIAAMLTIYNTNYGEANGKDTGVYFTLGTHKYKNAASNSSDYVIRRPLWTDASTDVPFNLDGVVRTIGAFGTYGFGDERAGTWAAELSFACDKVWNGEIFGLASNGRKPVLGAQFELIDQETGTVVETALSNNDGLYRLFHRYGALLTFSNEGADCAERKQYTGTNPNNISYTTLGEHFAPYWINSRNLKNKDSDNYANLRWIRDIYPIFDRFPLFNDLMAIPGGDGAWLAFNRYGNLHVVNTLDGNIVFSRSDHSTPPFAIENVEIDGSGGCSKPRIAINADGIIYCHYEKDGSTYESKSTDGGRTWSSSAVAFSGGDYPTISIGWHTGQIIRAALVGSNIKGTYQFPGDVSPSAEFYFKDDAGANLQVESNGFHVAQAPDSPMRWLGIFIISGESESSYWESFDNCQTFKRLS